MYITFVSEIYKSRSYFRFYLAWCDSSRRKINRFQCILLIRRRQLKQRFLKTELLLYFTNPWISLLSSLF